MFLETLLQEAAARPRIFYLLNRETKCFVVDM
jgi:hypothetical protein